MAQAARRMRMHLRRVAQVRERIALQSVGAGLEQEELRLELAQVRDHPRPCIEELLVAGARGKRNIELGAGRVAFSRLLRTPGPRIEITSVFVDVGHDEVGIALISIEHTVTVMHIDVYVCNALHGILRPQRLDRHSKVVEHAETGRAVTSRMMQPADRLESASATA